MKNEIEIKHTGQCSELVIREGQALPLMEPSKITITGIITAIVLWLTKRITEIKQKTCFILVSKSELKMRLLVDENNFYGTEIIAKLELSNEFNKFRINSSNVWDCFSLSDFIKMNRSYFQDKVIAMNLVTTLRSFKAKVSGEIDKFKDDRANFEMRKKQTVESNLPADFKIKIPVFKGQKPIDLTLEISIDPNTFGCSLICPEANDFINEQTDAIFDEQIKQIEEIAPDIAIIYV